MFDVDWSDAGAERVGDRLARKKDQKPSKKDDTRNSTHESISSQSSSTETKSISMGFFESIGFKRNSLSSKSKRRPSFATVADSTPDDKSQKRTSTLSSTAYTATPEQGRPSISEQSILSMQSPQNKELTEDILRLCGDGNDRTSKESKMSMLSKSTNITIPSLTFSSEEPSTDNNYSPTNILQPLRSPSCGAKTIERTSKDLNDEISQVAVATVETTIATDLTGPKALNSPGISQPSSQVDNQSVSQFVDDWFRVIHSSRSFVPSPGPQHQAVYTTNAGEVLLPPAIITPNQLLKKTCSSRLARKNTLDAMSPPGLPKVPSESPASWKSPDISSHDLVAEAVIGKHMKSLHDITRDDYKKAADECMAIRKIVAEMKTATCTTSLLHLTTVAGSVAGPNQHQLREAEKKMWLLFTLYRPCRSTAEGPPAGKEYGLRPTLKGPNILSLFDSKSTAAYLAAAHPRDTIWHASPDPVDTLVFPNTRTLQQRVGRNFIAGEDVYTAVHSLSLPSQFRSQDIPPLLTKIRRCLIPGGTFHLALIDPVPVPSSMGPRMSHWMDQNLVFNLEATFKCVTPGRHIPVWLQVAELWGTGSTTMKGKFRATCDFFPRDDPEEKRFLIQDELETTMGRILWQDVWGGCVRGDSWWWEDPEIMKECMKLGTFFEYHLIEAIRETPKKQETSKKKESPKAQDTVLQE
ncbi:hypothetical protein QBC35DRAFT_470784 [Podospora australis]|uniref:Uncharacterized protein n=1 Tax=Podospora australis TaxID=1536484 RepID=A0AAN6X4U3_9PEZI|nr:hypothetical protein QBC35DRAFT_470784 [Podospora australis]